MIFFNVLISFIRVTFPMNQLHLKYGQTDFDQASGSWGKNVEITRRLIFYLERLIIVRDWILNLVNLRPAQYYFLQILSWSAENAKCLAAPERLLPLADLKTSISNLSSLAWKKVQSSPDLHFALNKVLLWKFLITIHAYFRCCLNQKKLKNLKLKNAHNVCRGIKLHRSAPPCTSDFSISGSFLRPLWDLGRFPPSRSNSISSNWEIIIGQVRNPDMYGMTFRVPWHFPL